MKTFTSLKKRTFTFSALILVLLYLALLVFRGNESSLILILIAFVFLPSYLLSEIILVKGILKNAFEAYHASISIMFVLFVLLPILYKTFNINELLSYIISMFFPLFLLLASSYVTCKEEYNISMKNKKVLTLCTTYVSILLMILYILLANIPRIYIADETSYIFDVQLFDHYDIMPSFGILPYAPTISKYIVGRNIWQSYLYAIKFFTGISPHRLHLASMLFEVLLALVVLSLFYDILRITNIKLSLLASTIIISSPLVLPWSINAQVDLPQTYFILISIYFMLKSVKSVQGFVNDIDLHRFLLGLVYAFFAILFKANVLTMVVLFIVFVIMLYRSKNCLTTLAKLISKVLTVLLIIISIYVLIFDFGWFISWYFFGASELGLTLRKFLFYGLSVSEEIFGIFVEIPWDRYTVFSFDWKQWLDFINFALAPEGLTILLSSSFLILPFLTIIIRDLRTDIRFQILMISTYTSFWLYFLILVGKKHLHDFTRYALHVYVLAMILSLSALYNGLQRESSMRVSLIAVTATMLVLLGINRLVTLEFGGTRFFYNMSYYKYSFITLLIQAGAIILYIIAFKGRTTLHNSFLMYFMVIAFVFFIVFNNAVFSKCIHYSTSALNQIKEYVETIDCETNSKPRIVISNFYIYLRNYLDLRRFIVIPPPATKDEFKNMLKLVPEGSIIVLANDPRIAWYEYGNRYIMKYLTLSYIPIEYLGPYVMPSEPQLELVFDSKESVKTMNSSDNKVIISGKVAETRWGKALALDGVDDYIAIYNYSFGDIYTIELLFRMDEDPTEFGTYPHDVPWVGGKPVTKSLLAKRHHGFGEIMISITSEGQVIVYADNKNDRPRYEIKTPKGLIKKNEWYHLILVVDNSSARLYINGILVGESKVNGENMMLEEKGIEKEPLYIGADGTSLFKPWRYLKATVKFLRIYNKALSQEDIALLYTHIKKAAFIKHNGYVHAIYIKKSLTNEKAVVTTSNEIKLIDVAMAKTKYTCRISIDSNLNTTIILATVRFSRIINISKGTQTLTFSYFRNINANNRIVESTYICSRHIALDSFSNVLWLHVKHGVDSLELIICYTILLTLLTLVINGKSTVKTFYHKSKKAMLRKVLDGET